MFDVIKNMPASSADISVHPVWYWLSYFYFFSDYFKKKCQILYNTKVKGFMILEGYRGYI